MKLVKVDSNNEAVVNFYKRHYEAPIYLIPKKLDGIYYALVDGDQMLAVTRHEYPSPWLLRTSSTVVHKDFRGQGLGKYLNDQVEQMAKENGITKITCHIYIDNLSSLILKLKRGYIIEGTLYDHDEVGKHEYVLGKKL
jgi:ribosomal protein S18 acetylase RimI-like enzyme